MTDTNLSLALTILFTASIVVSIGYYVLDAWVTRWILRRR